MKNFCFALCIAFVVCVNQAFGSEAGMPQLNPEFWAAQIFWLILTFSSLYLIIWKVFLPKITLSIENRKSRVVNDLDERHGEFLVEVCLVKIIQGRERVHLARLHDTLDPNVLVRTMGQWQKSRPKRGHRRDAAVTVEVVGVGTADHAA